MIGEYWIIDPKVRRIRVLTLKEGVYEIHGDFFPGENATSILLAGFAAAVDLVLTAGMP
jgi:Uma2 family endonuclease